MADTKPVLELSGLRHTYGSGATACDVLHGIDLTVQRGEFAALIGPSGSGKSTLLNLIGLLETPSGGDVILGGKRTAALDDNARTALRNNSLGFVFQFHHLLSGFSALENVLMPLLARQGRASSADVSHTMSLLDAVGLGTLHNRRPSELSGGQQQRVAIARALAGRPQLLLADEPTGNLDTHTADDIFALFRRINAEQGLTFLVVAHDPRLAARCDRIVQLLDGRIVGDAPP